MHVWLIVGAQNFIAHREYMYYVLGTFNRNSMFRIVQARARML